MVAATLAIDVPVNVDDLALAFTRIYSVDPVTDRGAIQIIKGRDASVLDNALGPQSKLRDRSRLALERFVIFYIESFVGFEHHAVVAKYIQKQLTDHDEALDIANGDAAAILAAVISAFDRGKLDFEAAMEILVSAEGRVQGDEAEEAVMRALTGLREEGFLVDLDRSLAGVTGGLKRGSLEAYAAQVFAMGVERLMRAMGRRHRGAALVILYGFSDEQQEAVGEQLMAVARQLTGRVRC